MASEPSSERAAGSPRDRHVAPPGGPLTGRTRAELFASHTRLAHWIALDYYIPGAEYDDVHQEALAALWDATVGYDPEVGPFHTFAALVVRRHLMECITNARRGKRAVLTNSLRFVVNEEGEEIDVVDTFADPRTVEDAVLITADLEDITRAAGRLSDLEREALSRVLNGVPYAGDKSLDNALQRAREKLRKAAA